MGRRNSNRNRYSTKRVPKLTEKQIQLIEQQKEQERYLQSTQYIEDRSVELIDHILKVKGNSIKSTVQDLLLLHQGSAYNTVHIKDHDLEVKCDWVLLCYSHKVQKYIWLGFDREIQTGYILFYADSQAEIITELQIDIIGMEYYDIVKEIIKDDINREIWHINGFYNMQEGGTEIIMKDQLFDLIEDIPINEGENIKRKKHILEI